MRTPDIAIETGKISQILPSFIRSVCRSRFEYDPDELLDEQRTRAADQIAKSSIYRRYQFTSRHENILRENELSGFREIIRQKTGIALSCGCGYQRELRKRACWTCPVTRSVILVLEGQDKADDSESRDS
jgi:hypothetical protein